MERKLSKILVKYIFSKQYVNSGMCDISTLLHTLCSWLPVSHLPEHRNIGLKFRLQEFVILITGACDICDGVCVWRGSHDAYT